MIRKVVSNALYYAYKGRDIGHYSVSLSSRTLVYKGMFLSYQVKKYYLDLSDPQLASSMALTASPRETPGAILNETVTTGNCPW